MTRFHATPEGNIPFTAEEEAEWDAQQASDSRLDDLRQDVRLERDNLLAACDWTVLTDSPLTTAKKTEWKTYRQALRDITSAEGFPHDVTWPSEPS